MEQSIPCLEGAYPSEEANWVSVAGACGLSLAKGMDVLVPWGLVRVWLYEPCCSLTGAVSVFTVGTGMISGSGSHPFTHKNQDNLLTSQSPLCAVTIMLWAVSLACVCL